MIEVKGFPEHWKSYRINEIGEVVTGTTPSMKQPENYGGSFVWIKPGNLDKGKYVDNSEKKISEKGREKVRVLPAGSVLVSCIGNIGKVAIAGCELCTNQQINSIIPNRDLIDSVFLYYLIKRIKPYLENIASSAVIPLLNKRNFSNVKVSIPPIKSQMKIASILEKTDQIKQWRRESDNLTDDYLNSVFLEMFGDPHFNPMKWKTYGMSEICYLIRDGEHRTPTYVKDGVPFVTARNLTGDQLDLIDTKKISKEEHLIFSRRAKPNKGDLLMSKDGTIGVTKVIKTDKDFSIFVSVILLKLKYEIVDADFLRYLLSTHAIQSEIKKRIKGIAIKHLHLIDLRKLKVPLPPLHLQHKFSKIVNQIEKIKNHQKESKHQIDDLFNVVMQKAFRGELNC